ncbi:MAG: hypothetical protein R3B99_12325 [Polyangiales bacterium]
MREDTLDQALGLFFDAKLVREAEATGGEPIYRVPDQRRLALEYYKNNLLHFFVPSALISAAILRGDGVLPLSELRERVRWLSRLFKYEFMYRADAPFERIFDEALATLVEAGEVEVEGEGDDAEVRQGRGENGRHLEVYEVMLGSYVEAYHLAARAAEPLDEEGIDRKAWVKKTLALGQRMYLAGEIEHREAISKDKLEGAMTSLKDLGVVKLSSSTIGRGAEPSTIVTETLGVYLR